MVISRLTMVLAGATLGSMVVGFSSAVIASTLNAPGFYATMGLPMSPAQPGYSKTTSIISAANSIFYAGAFMGSCFIAWPAEKFGRVNAFRVTVLFHVIGCALQSGAMNQPMYLISRLISGFAVGQGTGVMTTYYSEVSLPQKRGLLGGLHGLMIEVGALIAAWIALGCFHSPNLSFAWRFPISLVCLISLVLLFVTFFIPETPRWLIRHGRQNEALKVLQSLHADKENSHIAEREFEQIQVQTNSDCAEPGHTGNLELFRDRSYLKRLGIAIGLVCFAQSNGILLIYNYSAIIYTTLGLSNADAVALSAGWITWTAICMVFGNMLTDRLGRRKMLMAGFLGCSSLLSIYTACLSRYLATQEKKWAVISVVFIFLDVIPYGACLGTNQFTVPTEFFPNHLRAFASGMSIGCIYLIQVLWLNTGPLALQRTQWRFYCTFIAIGFTGIFFVYFLVPETAGVPLEEIDAIFGKKVAVRLEEVQGTIEVIGTGESEKRYDEPKKE